MRRIPTFIRIHRNTEIDNGGCWVWCGSVARNGYGKLQVKLGGLWRPRIAHRVAYEAFRGPIPDGLEIDHLCRNRRCCNPEHLEPVTHAENMRRGVHGFSAGVPTHCKHGHPREPARKGCRVCKSIRNAKRDRRRKPQMEAAQ